MNYHIRVRACGLIIRTGAVLLVEFHDQNGVHYNLPAGGAEPGESVNEAVRREVREETCAEVDVGRLAMVYEYTPHLNGHRFGDVHSLQMIFECTLRPGSVPRLPDRPDPDQTDVIWAPLSQLHTLRLFPHIAARIVEYATQPPRQPLYLEAHRITYRCSD